MSQFFTSRGPKDQSFSFSISPSNEYSGLISFRIDWLDLLAVQGTLKSLLNWSEWLPSKSLQTINAGEGVEKREPSYIVGGNANQYSHYGEQCVDSLKNWKQNCLIIQQSHCWAYTPKKPELKETHVPQCSLQHCLHQLGHGNNLDVHWQMNG